jgi:hypothetical protein
VVRVEFLLRFFHSVASEDEAGDSGPSAVPAMRCDYA